MRLVMRNTNDDYKNKTGGESDLVDREWGGPTGVPMLEIAGCHRTTLKNFEVWCDRATSARAGYGPIPRLATAFRSCKSSTRHTFRNKFKGIYINGTGHGPEQGVGTAFSVQGQTNTDFNIWDDVVIECCRWAFD